MMDILHEALVALNDWVEDGCPKHPVFYKMTAICDNVRRFARHSGEIPSRLCIYGRELRKLFEEDCLDEQFPFNAGNFGEYRDEVLNATTWQNPKRLAWLKKHGQRTISE